MTEIARMHAAAEEPISPHELHTLIQVMFVGGNETAANTLTNIVARLARDEALWAEVKADRSLVPKLVDESLRFEAPAQGAFRQAKHDMDLGGVNIPAGSMIYAVFGSANFDRTLFTNPEEFDIHRDNIKRHLAFGFGTHNCIGQKIAREELAIAIDALLDVAGEVTLTHDDEDLADYMPSFVLYSPKRLRVRLHV